MIKPILYAIHGFLGLPSDWELLPSESLPIKKIVAIDIYKITSPTRGFKKWAKNFNETVQKELAPKILIGYSLGGRLALHAVLQAPSLWQGAIFISTHVGLHLPDQRQKRLEDDLLWAKRFESEGWSNLIESWNSRSVFDNTVKIVRKEENFSRKKLAEVLVHWSLGKQAYLLPDLENLNIPIMWLVGERDNAFNINADFLNFHHPQSRVIKVSDAGHRVLWDQPQKVIDHLYPFIKYLNKET